MTIATSIGIAFSDRDMISAHDAEELLRNADTAMYMAKENGKDHYQLFQPEMHARAMARLELKTDLQRALDAGEFTLRYQPIMDLDGATWPAWRRSCAGSTPSTGTCSRRTSSRCSRTPG